MMTRAAMRRRRSPAALRDAYDPVPKGEQVGGPASRWVPDTTAVPVLAYSWGDKVAGLFGSCQEV